MKILALETATESCSVALLNGGHLYARSEYAPRRHAELLLPMCDAVLLEAGLDRSEIDAIAVGRGPGAFTGVRLAIAAAQGLGLALNRPVVPISSLAAMAYAAPDNGATILAMIDARMGEIYAGSFVRDPQYGVKAISEEWVGPASEALLPKGPLNIVGTGWQTYADVVAARLEQPPVHSDGSSFPQASAVARLAMARWPNQDAGDAAAALPTYLRNNVALTLEEQRAKR